MRISDWSSDVCSSDLSPQVRKLLQDGTARVAKSAAAMGGAPEPTIRYLGGTGVMTNDETMAKAAVTVLTPVFGKGLAFAPASATPMSGSEDFSEFVDAGVDRKSTRLNSSH